MKKRRFLSAMGGLAVVGSGLLGSRTLIANAAELAMPSPECHPTIRQGEGPYLTPDSQLRSDIREDRPGVPVHLHYMSKMTFGAPLLKEPLSIFGIAIPWDSIRGS